MRSEPPIPFVAIVTANVCNLKEYVYTVKHFFNEGWIRRGGQRSNQTAYIWPQILGEWPKMINKGDFLNERKQIQTKARHLWFWTAQAGRCKINVEDDLKKEART